MNAPALNSEIVRRNLEARDKLLGTPGEPLFTANWEQCSFLHFEVPPDLLQKEVPFELDTFGGKAFVSLVFFTMRRMRLARVPGSEPVIRLTGQQRFLNLRTYVRHQNEPGIYFLSEWLSNRFHVALGPVLYGLPYRWAKHAYSEATDCERIAASATAPDGKSLAFSGTREGPLAPPAEDSLEEFLLERYKAFTVRRGVLTCFRVWHEVWETEPIRVESLNDELLAQSFPWWRASSFVGAHHSRGVFDVWMGKPRPCSAAESSGS